MLRINSTSGKLLRFASIIAIACLAMLPMAPESECAGGNCTGQTSSPFCYFDVYCTFADGTEDGRIFIGEGAWNPCAPIGCCGQNQTYCQTQQAGGWFEGAVSCEGSITYQYGSGGGPATGCDCEDPIETQ